MASDEIALPTDVTDVERLLFVLSNRGEMWKKMLLGNPRLNITINKPFVEKSAPVRDGDEIARVGFAVI
jgi:molybdopterin synthase sulfur carrier subunit